MKRIQKGLIDEKIMSF